MSELLKIDKEYANWIEGISNNFKKLQIKAAVSVNIEMLKFYWIIGKGIEELSQRSNYGSKLIDSISSDLKQALPNVKSFSPRNLRYMNSFYQFLSDVEILPQLGAKSLDFDEVLKSPQIGDESLNFEEESKLPQHRVKSEEHIKLPQVGAKSDSLLAFMIPWGHMKVILDKYKNDKEKALFYIKETIENNWSRAVLLNFIDTDLYERKGKAINNFDKNLPDVNSDLAKEMTRDPYNFDFLSIREKYDEKELKDALMDNIQKFLLELGSGFSFVGREYRLKVGETEQFLDMLFYNIKLKCYVVVEVKVRDFKPEDMGQLSTYVSCVNHILKNDSDNQTIGILICKNKDNVLAKYAIETQNEPVAISEYELSKLFPKDFKSSMPTIEEIERELK